MVDEFTVGSEPIQIVELEQPFCSLTYGVGPCTAVLNVTGDRKCYNTRATTQDATNYDPSDAIKWRFVKQMENIPLDIYDESGGVISTNPIPSLRNVSTSPTKINAGSGKEGDSPFGVRAKTTITLEDHPWDDSVGDKYLAERDFDPLERSTFWAKWKARNPFHTNLNVVIYEGYVGQTLAEMESRRYILERIDGPDARGMVKLIAKDPLKLADEKRAVFPPVSDLQLRDDIDDSQTTGIILVGDPAQLTQTVGLTADSSYFIRIDDEIIRYFGTSAITANETELTGATRGNVGTTAAPHDAEEAAQRVGRYGNIDCWTIVSDLLKNHTEIDPSLIIDAEWDTEGNTYLAGFVVSGVVAEPTPVEALIGELTEQCLFYVWWDERAQKIDMKAIRPQFSDPITDIDDTDNVLADSFSIQEDPQTRISRLFLYYNQRDPTRPLNEISNWRNLRGRIDADAESVQQYAESRTRQIFSRWIQSAAQALSVTVRILSRYRDTPKFAMIRLDAKDRALWTADVINLTVRQIVDDTGAESEMLWQIIAARETAPGEIVEYKLQMFEFDQLFAIWMADAAPDYSAATEEERQNGLWWGDSSGKVGGGTDDGYNWS